MDALDDYQATAQETRAKEVADLKGEMANLEGTLQDDARQAREKIDAWWDVLSEWTR